jgi:magnesium chelatase subunit I
MSDDSKTPANGKQPLDDPPNLDAEAPNAHASTEGIPANIRSIKDLINVVTGRTAESAAYQEDSGLAEIWPFPFFAIVGQKEMKLGLLLALINPAVGGVLLVGPRGTGKTTAVRGLIDLLPSVNASNCHYGCTEADIETGGLDAICPNCAEKHARGEPLSALRPVRLVELPLNAELEDVVGRLDERAALHQRMRVQRGILAHADKNLLYVDEVNLLNDRIVDAILDAAAQGSYTVRRGSVSATYRSRFTFIGSMNPEEGSLRPQILDRFGLRLLVRGLEDEELRMEAYERARDYLGNPTKVVEQWADQTLIARDEIQAARNLLPDVALPDEVAKEGLRLIKDLNIASLRAEITLFEAARAHAAADDRTDVSMDDIHIVAPMTLRLRHSRFIDEYFENIQSEEEAITSALDELLDGSGNGE